MKGRVIWFYGNSGAGKSTLADSLRLPSMIRMDGDEMRNLWIEEERELGFSKEDRIENNKRIAKYAKDYSSDGHNVIVSTICPYRELRDRITKMIPEITWCEVHSCREHDTTEEYPFEGGLGI